MDVALAAAIVVLALLVSATPALGVPVGAILGIYVLVADAPILLAALLGAAGVAAGRAMLALGARRRRGGRSDAAAMQAQAMRQVLASSGRYRLAVFSAAATPLVPARFLFPLLGSMGAPLSPAVAGAFFGQLPLLALTIWLFVTVARWATPTEQDAATLLGIMGICLVLARLIASVDWAHWRETGRPRMRPPAKDPRTQMLLRNFGGGGDTPGQTGIPGFPGGLAGFSALPRLDADDEDADIVDLEAVEDQSAGDDSEDPGEPGSPARS